MTSWRQCGPSLTTLTTLQSDDTYHLGLRCNALHAHQMARITSVVCARQAKCVRELDCRSFLHELVKQAVVSTADKDASGAAHPRTAVSAEALAAAAAAAAE